MNKHLLSSLLAVFVAVLLALSVTVSVFAVYDPTLVKSDINGDGKFNARDPALFIRYLAGWDVADEIKNPEVMDVDGDGKVTVRDVAILVRNMAGWC